MDQDLPKENHGIEIGLIFSLAGFITGHWRRFPRCTFTELLSDSTHVVDSGKPLDGRGTIVDDLFGECHTPCTLRTSSADFKKE